MVINVLNKPGQADNETYIAGECKEKMKLYMICLKANGSTSTPCRSLSKDYLDCRMQKCVERGK